jgi:hypothetical protein
MTKLGEQHILKMLAIIQFENCCHLFYIKKFLKSKHAKQQFLKLLCMHVKH